MSAGAASETLAEGVIHLDPEPSVFDAMLQGWAAQMASRGLKRTTMQSALWLVRRFAGYTNDYPWHWQPADVDEFCAWLSSGKQPRAVSTLRGYQIQLSMFCEYVCDPRYGWLAICQERFGSQPQQVCTEQNRARHVDNYEGDPGRRPLTPEELQAFFDYADEEVERIRQHGRKGALAAFRDAALFKVVYGWGLRRREAIMLDLADLHPNPTADRFGRYGALHVRWGKAKRGGAPRRRTVLGVFEWAVEALQQYVEEVRPAFGCTEHSALWVTERGSRLSARAVDERFALPAGVAVPAHARPAQFAALIRHPSGRSGLPGALRNRPGWPLVGIDDGDLLLGKRRLQEPNSGQSRRRRIPFIS